MLETARAKQALAQSRTSQEIESSSGADVSAQRAQVAEAQQSEQSQMAAQAFVQSAFNKTQLIGLKNGGSSSSSWTWSRVDPGGLVPAPREGHAAVEVGNKIFFFGGCVQGIRCFSDVHIFDTDSLSWSQEPFTGDAPEPRGGHSATLVGTDVFVFGGANSETTFGDVYKLDLVQRHWTRAVPSGCPAVPSRRTNHAAIADAHGRIYIMGGTDAESHFLNDMWILNVYADAKDWPDGNTFPIVWEKPSVTGHVPEARSGHSFTLVDRKVILFGGYTAAGNVANDVHLYNLDSQEWVPATVAGSVVPAPRQAHSAARHGRDVIIAGGCDVSEVHPECFNDVWILNTIDMRWIRKSSDAVSWFAREGHSAVFVRGRMFAFGGCRLTAECYSDMAVFDTSDPCPASCSGHGSCSQGLFCRCASGFTGHDCMQPLTCPRDCSGHGQCTESGTCSCENGWTGKDCATSIPCPGSPLKCYGHGQCLISGECLCFSGYSGNDCGVGSARCPHDCSGRGTCSAEAKCVCVKGFTGAACNIPLVDLQQLSSKPKLQQKKNMSMLAGFKKHDLSVLPSRKNQVTEVTGVHFGIPELNPVGHTGVQKSDCDDNCNFRGVCHEGTCYCQPSYYGKRCNMKKTSEEGTVSLWMLLIIGGACAIVSFSIMTLLLHLSMQSKRAKETEIGYQI
jgi:N-acetylneuraminic acid mutarotase